jgi:hypothetical protein
MLAETMAKTRVICRPFDCEFRPRGTSRSGERSAMRKMVDHATRFEPNPLMLPGAYRLDTGDRRRNP